MTESLIMTRKCDVSDGGLGGTAGLCRVAGSVPSSVATRLGFVVPSPSLGNPDPGLALTVHA